MATWTKGAAGYFFCLGAALLVTRGLFDSHLPFLTVAALVGGAQNGVSLHAGSAAMATTHFSAIWMVLAGRGEKPCVPGDAQLRGQGFHLLTVAIFLLGNATAYVAFRVLGGACGYVAGMLYVLVGWSTWCWLQYADRRSAV